MPRIDVTMGDVLLLVMARVLKSDLTAKAGASALISIVTGVSILVLDQPLAPRLECGLSLSSERSSGSLPSVCRLPGDGNRSVPLGTLLSSGSLSHARLSVGWWTEAMGRVSGVQAGPHRSETSVLHLRICS